MIELPEAYVLSRQINQTITGKTVESVIANAHPHGFAWYSGDPAAYDGMLAGRSITRSTPGTGYTCGGNIEIECGDMLLILSTSIKYHAPGGELPPKHQLLVRFTDGSHISCTVQMWGGMSCYPISKAPSVKIAGDPKPSPLTGAFDADYFNMLWLKTKPTLSVKAFLTTEQRIPGLGNGVLQDILWNARLRPRKKLQTITESEKEKLFVSVKETLLAMAEQGGRDTEKDLFNRRGGYKTVLSAHTIKKPCTVCGGPIVREAFLGGNIYYCPVCQTA